MDTEGNQDRGRLTEITNYRFTERLELKYKTVSGQN